MNRFSPEQFSRSRWVYRHPPFQGSSNLYDEIVKLDAAARLQLAVLRQKPRAHCLSGGRDRRDHNADRSILRRYQPTDVAKPEIGVKAERASQAR